MKLLDYTGSGKQYKQYKEQFSIEFVTNHNLLITWYLSCIGLYISYCITRENRICGVMVSVLPGVR